MNSTQISDQVKDLQCDFHKRCASLLQFILQSCTSKHNPIIVYGDCNGGGDFVGDIDALLILQL